MNYLVAKFNVKRISLNKCSVGFTYKEVRSVKLPKIICAILDDKQKEFIAFVLSKYVESGVDELDQEKLPQLLINKYQSMPDALEILGNAKDVGLLFMEFQKYLYEVA